MRWFDRLKLLSFTLAFLLVGGATAFAQVSTNSTPGPKPLSAADRALMDQILRPHKMEEYFKQNRTYEGRAASQKSLDQLSIPKTDLKRLDPRSLKKRGGVDSGGGDQLGLEFQTALGDSQLDYKQYAYTDNEDFLWSDLSQYGTTLTVIAVDQPFVENGKPTERIAKNDLVGRAILVQRASWNSIRDRRIKNAIALNQVLLMREGKETGYTQRALLTLVGEGLPGIVLYNGKSRQLDAKEAQATTEHQCLWSFKNLTRVSKAAEMEVYTCAYEGKPDQFSVRTSQVEGLISRCESLCSTQSDLLPVAQKCSAYRNQYDSLKSAAKRIRPTCVPGEKR